MATFITHHKVIKSVLGNVGDISRSIACPGEKGNWVGVEVEVDLSESEVNALVALIDGEIRGYDLPLVVVNYACRISRLPRGVNFVMVSAPGIDGIELAELRDHMENLMEDEDYVVVTNYDVDITGRVGCELKGEQDV